MDNVVYLDYKAKELMNFHQRVIKYVLTKERFEELNIK